MFFSADSLIDDGLRTKIATLNFVLVELTQNTLRSALGEVSNLFGIRIAHLNHSRVLFNRTET